MTHLPMTQAEMTARGWEQLDFLFVTGDAYVDHPSFGAAILTRLLESEGFKVGIIAQPSLTEPDSLLALGRPRLGVLVSSGVVDSMVDNYTAGKKTRSEDRYSAGGIGGKRPDRATIRYCTLVREQLGEIPLIIGGVEASLRRFAHYDYWSNKVRRSILQDSLADILIYGMGEVPLLEIVKLLAKGVSVRKINAIRGTCVLAKPDQLPGKITEFIAKCPDYTLNSAKQTARALKGKLLPENETMVMLPSCEEVMKDKLAYAVAFRYQYREQDPAEGKTLIQRHSGRYLVQNPPQRPMSTAELDRIYDLPYERTPHPSYQAAGGVPSIEEVRFSINSHRGCFGGCHFCAITFHQGRIVQRRSSASILREAKLISEMPDFKGYIHDVGGPTANFFGPACEKQRKGAVCKGRQCLFPEPCPSLEANHGDYLTVLRQIRELPGVKKVFIRSGIRFDYLLLDEQHDFLTELCQYHISGQLKVAPEHVSRRALLAMGKPPPEIYRAFKVKYEKANHMLGLKQFLVPYLISGHPGCDLEDAIELAMEIKASRVMPEQVQDFYPTPGTVSTVMYYTGMDPFTLEMIHIPDGTEKALQRALLQFGKPENREKVLEALRRTGRTDLIGYGPDKLVPSGKKFNRSKPADQAVETDNREASDHGNHHQGQRTGGGHPQPAPRRGRRDLR